MFLIFTQDLSVHQNADLRPLPHMKDLEIALIRQQNEKTIVRVDKTKRRASLVVNVLYGNIEITNYIILGK